MPHFNDPRIFLTPFAANGTRNNITEEQLNFGAASLSLGFPPETQQPEEAGGIPPDRADFNGAFHLLSSHTAYQALGGRYKFSPVVAEAKDNPGYPKGAVLAHDNPAIPYLLRSLKDNNTDNFNTNPEVIGVSWAVEAQGVSLWNEHTIYRAPCLVFGPNGTLYMCLQDNGPGTQGGVRSPFLSPDFWTDTASRYEICEFYFFRNPTLRPGFMPLYGGVIEDAATLYPEAWAFLRSDEGRLLCKTEAEWQAMTRYIWHTNADGTTVGWDGIGGAPFFAPNWETGALRLPDVRGMMQVAADGSLGVGDVDGDRMRNVLGYVEREYDQEIRSAGGALYGSDAGLRRGNVGIGSAAVNRLNIDISRVVPTGPETAPKRYGVLPCVYLGRPR